jgi:DNA-binding MarR family transcriptional regulator
MAERKSAIVSALEAAGIFTFDASAIAEIDRFIAHSETTDPNRLYDHLVLASAEFALMPNIATGKAELPIKVRLRSARIATVKFNCGLTCGRKEDDDDLSLVTVFSADAARINRFSVTSSIDSLESSFGETSGEIRKMHRDSGSSRAHTLAARHGVLDIQGLLWQLQMKVRSGYSVAEIKQEVNRYQPKTRSREQRLPESRHAVLRPMGLTDRQYTALSMIAETPGISAAELARQCQVNPQVMTKVLGNLTTKGLIERHAVPGRGRVLETTITRSGRSLLARADKKVEEVEDPPVGQPIRVAGAKTPTARPAKKAPKRSRIR